MFAELFTPSALKALVEVLIIDIVLAGDNAIVVGLAAAGLPPEQRRRAIMIGIGAATLMRIGFALVTTQLLQIIGLLFVGGLLLLWVCWKMYRELSHQTEDTRTVEERLADAENTANAQQKTMTQAMWQIVIADVSMSLDNVLAVAGAAKDHPYILVFGLAVSVVLMGVAASFIARLIERHRWIAWVGLVVILYVALQMMWDGIYHPEMGVRPYLPW
ncbi:MAG: TerC family protein [Alphaproteobacteria bacterium]|nr:TerC family protein [Alphaproteobacteria bacterium]